MKHLTPIVAATLVACAPAPTQDPLDLEPFCDTEHSIPPPYRGCTTIRGNFAVALDNADCSVQPERYCCMSTSEEVYVSGSYTVESTEAALLGCNSCEGKNATFCE